MPVFVPLGEDPVGPYRRLSASQLNVWEACPRQWFLEKVRRLKIAQTPPLHLGKAVEDAVCRTLRESPGLVMRHAPSSFLDGTPLNANGAPDAEALEGWPATAFPVLLSRPDDLSEVRAWAFARVEVHLQRSLDEEHSLWLSDPRKSGDWSETISFERALGMARKALDLHLEEVSACLEANGGPALTSWRAGDRPSIPAPDGRPFVQDGPHPLAGSGHCDALEAWEIARPWFVDPDVGAFASQAVHPSFRFQGEYDLVYRWRGSAQIVDLKASTGASDRTAGYHEQLRAYAALWRATHEDGALPSRLSIWFLGTGDVVDVEVPDEAWCDDFEVRIDELWARLKAEDPTEADCPPRPAPYRHHGPGGVPLEADDDPLARCTRCEWSSICPGPNGALDEVPQSFQLPGASTVTSVDALEAIDPRVDLHLEVYTVFSDPQGPPKIHLTDGQRQAELAIAGRNVPEGVDLDLEKGQRIHLVGALPEIRRGGHLVLKVDPASTLSVVEAGPLTSLALQRPARVDVVGRVAYLYEKSGIGRTGRPWSRPGLMLIDGTGTIMVEGWSNAMPRQYEHLQPGDVVAVTNLEAGAWISQLQGNLLEGSQIRVLHAAQG